MNMVLLFTNYGIIRALVHLGENGRGSTAS